MARRKLRRLGLILGIIVFGAVAIALFERMRGSREVTAVLQDLSEAGVELDPMKLLTNSVPDWENAAAALLQITNELQSFRLPAGVGAIPLMKLIDPGVAGSVIDSESWPGQQGETFRWEQLKETHAEALELYKELIQISKFQRFASALDASEGVADMEIKGLATLPSVMRVLRLVAAYDLHEGNDERAVESVIALLNIFPNKSEDRWNIAEMVRWSYARLGMSLTWELLEHADLPEESWKRLQTAWEKCHFLDSYAKAARVEIAGVSDYFVRLKASAAYRENILQKFEQLERGFGASWSPLFRGRTLRRIHLPVWRLLWADQDYAYSLRNRASELRLAEFARNTSWQATQHKAFDMGRPDGGVDIAAPDTPSLYDRARYLFSFSPEPIQRVDLLRAFQSETEARLAVAAIALRRFSVETGRYPDRIEELAPRYINEVPKDPMDGEPLKYRVLEDGRYLLYSSGKDGEDDGGEAREEDSEDGLTLWSTADVIWPRRWAP